jgi:hypothetical protein
MVISTEPTNHSETVKMTNYGIPPTRGTAQTLLTVRLQKRRSPIGQVPRRNFHPSPEKSLTSMSLASSVRDEARQGLGVDLSPGSTWDLPQEIRSVRIDRRSIGGIHGKSPHSETRPLLDCR